MEWLEKVLRAGEETEVYKVRESPAIGYNFEKNGYIWGFLRKEFQATGRFWMFGGINKGIVGEINGKKAKIESHLAYYNRKGEIEESDIDDMGALLAWLRPEDADENRWGIWMRHHEPVEISHLNFTDYRNVNQKEAQWMAASFNMHLHRDIWFPWVYGMNEENSDTDKRFSNHELARRHTPRLNEFIQTVRQATLDMGGKWEIDTSEPSYTDRTYLFMLSDEGINLDAPLPAEYSENHTLYFG